LSTALWIIPWNKVLLQKRIVAQLPKKFPNFLSPKFCYLVLHTTVRYLSFLNQINPLHALPSYFFKITFNIILQSIRICQVAPLLHVFLLKACITNSKEQSPSGEAKSALANQNIPCILWSSEVQYRITSLYTSVCVPRHAQFIVHLTILREIRIVKNREAKKGILTKNSQTACFDICSKTTVDLYEVHLYHHTDTILFIRAHNYYSTQIIVIILHELGPDIPVSTSQNIPTYKTGPRTVKT
jgi:hypothetical protein